MPASCLFTASLPGGLGIAELNQYDAADHLLTATLAGPLIQTPGLLTNTSVLSSTYGYGYTPVGWISAATSTIDSVITATQLAHDPLGRLTQAAGPPGDLWLTRPTTTTRTLGGLACPTLSVCYAVGTTGVILDSTDGGATWSGQASGVTTTLNAVACPLAGTCNAVGDGGVIRMTSNGGASWVSSTSGITTNLESVSCPSTTTCYAAGAGGKLLVLSGGRWTAQTSPTTKALWGISCSGATTCTAVGSNGTIIGTTDGSTWSAETRPTTLQLSSVSCPTSSFCAAVGVTGTLAISSAGGGWALQTSNTSQALTGVSCPSASQCLAVGASGTLLSTADAGLLWTTQATTSTATLQAASCVDTSTCVAVGTSGTILTSSGRSAWSYDGNGNLLTSDTTGITTTYGYASAITPNLVLTLTTPGQINRYYGYDQNGDTTAITTTTGSLNTQLSYDSQARPITVTLADGTQVVQGYNAQGQRSSYTVSKGGTTSYSAQFSYRGAELGQAVIVNGAQAYTDTYLYGPSGLPLELLRQQGGSTSRYYYEEDGRGNVVALTNISGTVVDHYAYDVWGRLTGSSEQVPQRLRYGGYWYDQELGWYWVSVRFYDPVLERWVQPDPSQQDGVRTYVYVGDDPVDHTDPNGLDGCGAGASSFCNSISSTPPENPTLTCCQATIQPINPAAAPRAAARPYAGAKVAAGSACTEIYWPALGSVFVTNNAIRSAIESMTNAINDHLQPSDVQGAWLEAHGMTTAAEQATGTDYQHEYEVDVALRSLRNGIRTLRGKLGDSRVSAADRAVAEYFIRIASKTMDYVDKVLDSPQYPADYRIPFEPAQSVEMPDSVLDPLDVPLEPDMV